MIQGKACQIDLDSGEVRRGDQSDRLSPRLLALLRHFVERQGTVVSRDELMTAVWGHLEAASDDSVNVAVSALRRHLGDSARPARVIQTVPRRGYLYTGVGIELVPPGSLIAIDDHHDDAPAGPAAATAQEAARASEQEQTGASAAAGSVVESAADRPARRSAWPRALLALLLLPLAWWLLASWPTPPQPAPPTASSLGAAAAGDGPSEDGMPPAVAVLPFLDLSPAADQSYLADALVDRIIHVLAQAQGLQVAARTSSFAYRDRPMHIEQIGRELGVDAVLEGSVLHQDGQMRVLAQLIDADTGKHLWSRAFDRDSEALFDLQDEIANEVARTMTDTLLPADALQRPVSRAAYDLVSRAHARFDEGTVASLEAALQLFRQALEFDPNYVDALVGIYEATGLALALGSGLDEDARQAGLAALQQARQLAPDDPVVLRARAAEQRRLRDTEQALTLYRLAVAARPNDALAWGQMGDLLMQLTRYEEALEALRRAARIDPLSLRVAARLADAYWSVGRAEEAVAKLRSHLARQASPMLHDRMATYLNQLGRTGEAMRHVEAARRLDPESGLRWFRQCEFHLQLADVDGAERCTQAFSTAHDMPFREVYLRQILLGFRGDWDAQHALMEELLALAHPADPLTPALVAMSWARYDCGRAESLLRERFASMYQQPPQLTPVMSYAARTAIHCLQQHDPAAAAALLKAFMELIERLRLQQGPWAVGGDEMAAALGLAGDHDAALAELQRLVDAGWRYYWWGLESRPEYAGIRERPAFAALQQQLRAGVEAQYQYWRAHRDEPLLR